MKSFTLKMPSPDEPGGNGVTHCEKPPLVVIVGPTAAGKTEIAIRLAQRLNGEIVSADSRLFYRGMDIGTAKPSLEERQGVPHHLIDVTTPDQPWSLATFQAEARKAIAGIHERGRLPFLVGGTGQYVQAVVQAWQAPRVSPDPAIRQALEAWAQEIGYQGLWERLARLDQEAAQAIDARNLRRTVRALEVILISGRRFSEQRTMGEAPYQVIHVGLERPRPELYSRIDQRIEAMLAAGLVAEVEGLLRKGYPPDLPAFSGIGYRQIIDYLQGKISLEEAVTLIKRQTRIFVRRQGNWFKRDDPNIRWYSVSPGIEEEIVHYIT